MAFDYKEALKRFIGPMIAYISTIFIPGLQENAEGTSTPTDDLIVSSLKTISEILKDGEVQKSEVIQHGFIMVEDFLKVMVEYAEGTPDVYDDILFKSLSDTLKNFKEHVDISKFGK